MSRDAQLYIGGEAIATDEREDVLNPYSGDGRVEIAGLGREGVRYATEEKTEPRVLVSRG